MDCQEAWQQAFGLLELHGACCVADAVVAGLNAATNHEKRGEWLAVADCLNRMHYNRTMH